MKMKTIQKIQIPQNEDSSVGEVKQQDHAIDPRKENEPIHDDSHIKDIEEYELLVKDNSENHNKEQDNEDDNDNNEDDDDVKFGPLDVPYIPGKYDDFIGTYEKCVPPEMCRQIIRSMDYYMTTDSVWCEDDQFPDSMAGRFGYSIDLGHMTLKMDGRPDRDLNEVIFAKLREYIHIFGHIKRETFYSTCQKVQMTPPGGGYHVWHDENTGSGIDACRCLVWMVYLNDDFEGGETEFLYYKKRIKPETGKLLIWPAGMTHAHKGNMVLSGSTKNKYVITGWFNVGGGHQ